MKFKIILLFISFLVISFAGCQRLSKEEKIELREELTSFVKYANNLEKELFEKPDEFETETEVYEHFRQGFSKDLATDITSYLWEDGNIKASEIILAEPDSEIKFLKLSADEAEVYYETPEELRNTWGLKIYKIDKLRKEKGGWVIYQSIDTDYKPRAK